MKQTLCHERPFSSAKVTEKSRVPTLFAEGVDVGVEIALRWMEAELVHNEALPSVEKALNSIRRQFRQARRNSFLQQSLSTSDTR